MFIHSWQRKTNDRENDEKQNVENNKTKEQNNKNNNNKMYDVEKENVMAKCRLFLKDFHLPSSFLSHAVSGLRHSFQNRKHTQKAQLYIYIKHLKNSIYDFGFLFFPHRIIASPVETVTFVKVGCRCSANKHRELDRRGKWWANDHVRLHPRHHKGKV